MSKSSSSEYKIPVTWLIDLSPDEREDFKQHLIRNKWIRERLIEIIDREIKIVERSELSEDSYDKASWPYLQAHRNGKKEALKWLKEILTIEKK